MAIMDLIRKVLALPRKDTTRHVAALDLADSNISRMRRLQEKLEAEKATGLFGVVHDMRGVSNPHDR